MMQMKTNQVMKRPMGNFLVEQRTKDSMFNAVSFDELMNKDVELENFSSLKNEFKKKKEWNHESLLSFQSRLFVCLCPNEDREELCEIMNEISKWIAMTTPIRFSINSSTTKSCKECGFKTYIMIDHNTGFYKIGKSKNPCFREKTLQSEKPTIEMILIINQDIEKELHQKYSDKRVRGEWFQLDDQVIEYLRKKYSEKHLPSVLKLRQNN